VAFCRRQNYGDIGPPGRQREPLGLGITHISLVLRVIQLKVFDKTYPTVHLPVNFIVCK
jgi:hypothetical protein